MREIYVSSISDIVPRSNTANTKKDLYDLRENETSEYVNKMILCTMKP